MGTRTYKDTFIEPYFYETDEKKHRIGFTINVDVTMHEVSDELVKTEFILYANKLINDLSRYASDLLLGNKETPKLQDKA